MRPTALLALLVLVSACNSDTPGSTPTSVSATVASSRTSTTESSQAQDLVAESIVYGDGALYALATNDIQVRKGWLERIDPRTGRVTHRVDQELIPVGSASVHFAAGLVWVAANHTKIAGADDVVAAFDAADLHRVWYHDFARRPLVHPLVFAGSAREIWIGQGTRLFHIDACICKPARRMSVAGTDIADLAVSPDGARLYVEQYSGRQLTSVSVRSPIDGRVLVAPRVVGAGPGPGHITAANNGVWLAQPTGNLGGVTRLDPVTLEPTVEISANNAIRVRVEAGLVLVDRASPSFDLRCLDAVNGLERGHLAPIDGVVDYASDGKRLFLATLGGIEVRWLPRACRAA